MFPTFSNVLNILKCYQPLTMFSTFSNFLNILKCSQPLQMFSTTKLGTTLHHTTLTDAKKRPFSDLVLILELCTHAPMPSTPVLSAPVISLQIFWKNLDRQCWKYLLKIFVESICWKSTIWRQQSRPLSPTSGTSWEKFWGVWTKIPTKLFLQLLSHRQPPPHRWH